jgi:hypothetical protein
MRIIDTILAGAVGLALIACSKDGAIMEFVQENDSLVAEIKKTDDPDAARKVFDSKEASLKAKLEPLKEARGFQVKEESMTALSKSLQDGVTTVCGLHISAIGDEAKSAKYKSLCEAYTAVMSM